MTRDQIEKLAYDVLKLYSENKRYNNEYINVEELSYLLGFEIIDMPLVEKGLLGLLGKRIDDGDGNFVDFIAIDSRLNLENYREVVSDLLMQYIIEDFEEDKKQFRIVTEVGSTEYLELVIPKEKFLEKHLEFSNNHAFVFDDVLFEMSNYFNVSKEAIIRRYESLEILPINEREILKKEEIVLQTLKLN